ncbi:hypothetical protein SAMN05414137_1457 [Streptacidiphilus jiangxiensis]|uniref:Uncharacterized protein n=1 Tax=Streptacidiphilus jiangxiensis TaxID=235985 RepID=A0A1H8AIQ8_STRJI|nr:hypothetical protein SAMN05414137_1457 [Streptacidiphilus jiangxiensis]
MPAVLPRRQPRTHRASRTPSVAVPLTNPDFPKASTEAKGDPRPQAVRSVVDEHQNELGYCVVCCTTWPCEVVLAQLSTTGFAS